MVFILKVQFTLESNLTNLITSSHYFTLYLPILTHKIKEWGPIFSFVFDNSFIYTTYVAVKRAQEVIMFGNQQNRGGDGRNGFSSMPRADKRGEFMSFICIYQKQNTIKVKFESERDQFIRFKMAAFENIAKFQILRCKTGKE